MAEIIGYDPSIKKTCTCKTCTAIVSYTPGEVDYRAVGYSSMGTHMGKFIDCPNCGKAIRLERE